MRLRMSHFLEGVLESLVQSSRYATRALLPAPSRYRAVIGVAHEPGVNVAHCFSLRNKRCSPVERGNRASERSQVMRVDVSSCTGEPDTAEKSKQRIT